MPDRAAADQHLGAPLQREALARAPLARPDRLRPRLYDVQFAVGSILRPLDIHRSSIVFLDGYRIARQLEHVLIRKRKAVAIGLRNFHHPGRAARRVGVGENHLLPLGAQPASNDRRAPLLEHRLVDIEFVRVDCALDHHFPQAVGTGDEDHPGETRLRVQGEHHAARGEVAAHHLLHGRGQGNFDAGEAVMDPIRDRAIVVQRREDLTDRVQHVVDPTDVEEGFLLARE